MYHSKRRYSLINRIIKSCKRAANQFNMLLTKSAKQGAGLSTGRTSKLVSSVSSKLHSLGLGGTLKIAASIASIFLFVFVVSKHNTNQMYTIFADSSINVKEVDDAYISLDGAILEDSNSSFGARFAYIVKPGDTLEDIAREFGVTVTSLKENNGLKSNTIRQGQEIIISSVDGFTYEVTKQTTIRDLALQFHLDLDDLKELNALQNDHDLLREGDQVFVPLTLEEGKKLGLILPDPEPVVALDVKLPTQKTSQTTTVKTSTQNTTTTTTVKKTTTEAVGGVWRVSQSRAGCFGFVPGQCTCYAAQKRPDIFVPGKSSPWRGNARNRYANAQAAGYSVGTKPAVGAIAVMSQGWGGYGHVGIVVDVSSDSILLESMNWVGPYIVNRIWIKQSQIRGYIY